MSKLQAYNDNLLLEKISKKEIDTALKNKNILIGCEFEFISYEMEGVADSSHYDEAFDTWKLYRKSLEKFGKEYDAISQDMYRAEQKKEEAEEEISNTELEIEDVEDDEEMISLTKERKLKELKQQLEEFEAKKERAREEYQEGEDSQQWIELDYVDLDPYKEYMENFMGEDPTKDFEAIIWALEYREWKADEHFLPEPPDYSDDSQTQSAIENIDFDDAPFSNYEIGGYGEIEQHVGSDLWGIEPDDSLDEHGIEIKSPPTPLPEALEQIEDMFDWIEGGRGHTDNRCGFHIHMSLKGVNNLEKVLDPVKIILFTDEEYIWKLFPDRKSNTYVKSIKDKLKTTGDVTKVDWSKMIDINKAKAKMFSDHFDAISFRDMSSGHIEFRYLGSKDYTKRFKEIKAIIGRYAHNFALATDETYKRKEYFLKLQRIFNKIEYVKLKWERGLIQGLLNDKSSELDNKQEKLLTKRVKEITNTLRNLPYKIDRETYIMLLNNAEFTNTTTKELKIKVNTLIKKDVVDGYLIRDVLMQSRWKG